MLTSAALPGTKSGARFLCGPQKRKAGRRYGAEKALSLGSHLPSNAEIHAELQRLLGLYEEKVLPERLLHLRLIALRQMELLAPFRPHLVGSVLSGVVTERSDIDLHRVPKSSITGQAMERATAKQLQRLIATMVASP